MSGLPALGRRSLALLAALVTAFVVLVAGTLLISMTGRADVAREPATSAGEPAISATQAASAAPPASPSEDAAPQPTEPLVAPPAYLAWASGGMPDDLERTAASLPHARSAVAVAGDTSWLTLARSADDTILDRPKPPFAIPIDAFAVDPQDYAPFLPARIRHEVVQTLTDGRGVVGERAARLRRAHVGAVYTFGNRSVRVGAIVPDELIGWSELLVSRQTGARLGIEHERYLLARMRGRPSLADFEADVSTLLEPGTAVRVVEPGGSPFMRVASGVQPPLAIKEAFGEFSAEPDPNRPGYLIIDPDWVHTHIETRQVPLLGRLTCNETLLDMLIPALREIERQGLGGLIHSTAGCYNARMIARDPDSPPSNHAYGAAVDINAPENPYGATPSMDPRIVSIMESHGFLWGGNFLVPDGMHFEWWQTPRHTGG